MSKKHYIAIADAIKAHNFRVYACRQSFGASSDTMFMAEQIRTLADVLEKQSPRFDAARWIRYIEE